MVSSQDIRSVPQRKSTPTRLGHVPIFVQAAVALSHLRNHIFTSLGKRDLRPRWNRLQTPTVWLDSWLDRSLPDRRTKNRVSPSKPFVAFATDRCEEPIILARRTSPSPA
jgi:hypothetical protein